MRLVGIAERQPTSEIDRQQGMLSVPMFKSPSGLQVKTAKTVTLRPESQPAAAPAVGQVTHLSLRLLTFPTRNREREFLVEDYARWDEVARNLRGVLENVDARKAEILAELVGEIR
jgi:hypothetical protein